MKKWIIANTLMLFIMFSLGIYGKAQTWDSGLNKVTTVVEIQKMLSDVPIRTMDSNLDGSEEVANDLTADEQIEHLSPHLMRHSCLTQMSNDGVDTETISRVAGHSSSAITSKIYVHVAQERVEDAMRSMAI